MRSARINLAVPDPVYQLAAICQMADRAQVKRLYLRLVVW
jgi:hypothetical protein